VEHSGRSAGVGLGPKRRPVGVAELDVPESREGASVGSFLEGVAKGEIFGPLKRRRVVFAVAAGVVLLGLTGWIVAGFAIKRGVREPPFEVRSRDGDVEIRRYRASIVAATVVEGPRELALNEAFQQLTNYIFKNNRTQAKIAMTAPVSAQRSEKIAMTAPVSATPVGAGRYRVTFSMPAEYGLDTLPIPNDARVTLEEVPAHEVLALRFTGRATDATVDARTRELIAWAQAHALSSTHAPTLAQYDPPFVFPLLRRNEILLPL